MAIIWAINARMKAVLLLLAVVCIPFAGCDNDAPIALTVEQSVYETLFFQRVGNTYSNIYIAGATDASWFQNNPIERVRSYAQSDGLEVLSSALLDELYSANEKSEPWVIIKPETHLMLE